MDLTWAVTILSSFVSQFWPWTSRQYTKSEHSPQTLSPTFSTLFCPPKRTPFFSENIVSVAVLWRGLCFYPTVVYHPGLRSQTQWLLLCGLFKTVQYMKVVLAFSLKLSTRYTTFLSDFNVNTSHCTWRPAGREHALKMSLSLGCIFSYIKRNMERNIVVQQPMNIEMK